MKRICQTRCWPSMRTPIVSPSLIDTARAVQK